MNFFECVVPKLSSSCFKIFKVFGPKSQQRSIYDQAISPIVNEVLEGFNCTVFAYGQTGTGKTYTMEGGMRTKVWQYDHQIYSHFDNNSNHIFLQSM